MECSMNRTHYKSEGVEKKKLPIVPCLPVAHSSPLTRSESGEGRNRMPAVLPDHPHEQAMFQPHLIACGSTQMGKTMFIVSATWQLGLQRALSVCDNSQ